MSANVNYICLKNNITMSPGQSVYAVGNFKISKWFFKILFCLNFYPQGWGYTSSYTENSREDFLNSLNSKYC